MERKGSFPLSQKPTSCPYPKSDDDDDDDDDNNNNNNNTPWSRVILVKLICSQIVKKFPGFYGNERFITAFTKAHQMSLS
jgi:hypothetical protein